MQRSSRREHVVKFTKTNFGKRGPGQPGVFHSRGSTRHATQLHMLHYVLRTTSAVSFLLLFIDTGESVSARIATRLILGEQVIVRRLLRSAPENAPQSSQTMKVS